MTERPFSDTNKPGRRDINGVEWWACDPYPTWFRYEEGNPFPITNRNAAWEDEFPFGKFRFQTGIIVRTLNSDDPNEACEAVKRFVELWNAVTESITIEMPLMEPERIKK